MISYFNYSTDTYTVSYNRFDVVLLPSEPHTIYVSLSDNNDHHPHDNDHWTGIPEYNGHTLYSKGKIVYCNYEGRIIYCRSRYDANYDHPDIEGWKCSTNLQDLGVIPMVMNTISPPRNFPTCDSTPSNNGMSELRSPKGQNGDHVTGHCSGSYSIVGGYNNTILPPKTLEDSKGIERLKDHPKFNKTKELYSKALKVEMRKRGHSESSRIKSRWGTELDIIEEFIIKGKELPENTDKALDRVCDELLKYTESAGEYVETTNSYIDINTMIDVMLHPAK